MRQTKFGKLIAPLVISLSLLTPSANAWNTSTFGVINLAGAGGDLSYSQAIDSSGNIYLTGVTTNRIDLDPSPTSAFTIVSNGGSDVFLAKYNSNGDFLWGLSFGGTSNETPNGLAVDTAGNVYLTGNFENTTDFDPSAATLSITSNGSVDLFVSKFSTSGSFLWVKRIGGSLEERSNSIAIDSNNNLLVTGFYNLAIDFNPAPLETATLTSLGGINLFVLKLNSDGLYVWAKNVNSSDTVEGKAIVVDGSDNLIVTGRYRGSPDFDPGPGNAVLAGGATDSAFILKLTSVGAFVFAKSFANASNVSGTSVKADSNGAIYTVGYFDASLDLDPNSGTINVTAAGLTDVFISKIDASGNTLWGKSIGGSSYDAARTVALDSSGNPVVGGYYSSTVDFDPGAGVYSLTSVALYDAFVWKLNAFGEFLWVSPFTGQGSQKITTITFTSSGYLLVWGDFDSQIDFDPSSSVTLNFYPNSNFSNVFLVRLAPDGSLSPATLIDKAVFNSLGLSGGGIVATFRSSTTLVANVNVAAKVSFQANGKFLPGCRNLIASGSGTNFSASCTWKPAIRGSALITGIAIPTAPGISAGTSTPIGLVVANRSVKR
jgi:hypothetical protein